jgi:SOS response regulatory protein OraA/RecX
MKKMLNFKKNIMAPLAILALALILTMATTAAAFADTTGQGGYSGGGQMQNELIQALATASGQTAAQIQQDVTNGQTLPQLAEQLAQAGTITQSTLAAAIQQAMASNEQQRANDMATNLISGQTSGQPGATQGSGQWQNSGQGNGQNGDNMLVQALATASGQTTAQIQQDVTNGQTLPQLAEQLAQAGTITQSTLAAAIQQAMASNDQTRAGDMATSLISGTMPGRTGGSHSTTGSTTTNGIVLTIGSSRMYVNGAAQDIDPGNQTSPVIVNGSTFVPIGAIINSLGGTVSWDGANQEVTITLNNTTVVLNIGNKIAAVNGAATTLDGAPYISATGRTMLPLRFITESLGHTVNWDPSSRTITIQ